MMVIILYLVSMFMLIFLSVATGDIYFLSLPSILGVTLLHLFAYAVWQLGGGKEGDTNEFGKRRRLRK